MDNVNAVCQKLRKQLRERPTLPVKHNGEPLSAADVATGVRLPLYTCPFINCNFHTNNRPRFLHHVAGGVSDATHKSLYDDICSGGETWLTRLDYISGAVAIAERERWPQLGLSVTRRCLNLLCNRYNDEKIKGVCCFICCQLRTTCEGYPYVHLEKPAEEATFCKREIDYLSVAAICNIEQRSPGTLLNNCSYELWRRRYNARDLTSKNQHPWANTEPISEPLRSCENDRERHISRWAVQLPFFSEACMLFGCTEDISCECAHEAEFEQPPYIRKLCPRCVVPICKDCIDC